MWFANAGVLGRAHRVYAVNQIGDAGKSVADGRPVRRAEDFMGWLDGLLDKLGLEAAAFCGHSYGAWLALSYSLHSPGRVTKLALLDPTSCFGGMNLGYRLRAVPLLARPSMRRVRSVPTLLLLAEKSKAHNIRRIGENAGRLMPPIVSTILPNASHHSIPAANPDRLNQELAVFLA